MTRLVKLFERMLAGSSADDAHEGAEILSEASARIDLELSDREENRARSGRDAFGWSRRF